MVEWTWLAAGWALTMLAWLAGYAAGRRGGGGGRR